MKKVVHVSGKRKKAIARATLKEGKGIIKINNKPLEIYQPEIAKMKIMEPLLISGNLGKNVNIDVNVFGGGWQAQAEASRLAIAKALIEFSGSKQLKQQFLDYDRHLLVADVRRNEPHKPNDSKPRAKRQKSYR
jgi:small subunit ribosomal protein S9